MDEREWVEEDLDYGVKRKVQSVENDEYDDVVAAFGESVVGRSGAEVAGFGI